MAATVLSRLRIYGIIAIIILGIVVISLAGYRLYYNTVAATPTKAVRTYLETLGKGDLVALYEMSRGSTGQTQAEFASVMGTLLAEQRLSTENATIEPIGQQGNISYYRVMAKLLTSDGSYRLLPLICEAIKEGNAWRVAIYLPPAAYPFK